MSSSSLPSLVLSTTELCDLDLLMQGAFDPVFSYLSENEYNSVLSTCRLLDGRVWPMPIQLCIEANVAISPGDEVRLLSQDNTIVAHMKVTDRFPIDVEWECKCIVHTTDPNHPYVQAMQTKRGKYYLGGKVFRAAGIQHFDFQDLRLSPAALKDKFEREERKLIVGFQTRNPMHQCHVALIQKALEELGPTSHALLHPIVGETQAGDVDKYTRVRCYQKVLPYFPPGRVTLAVLPLAMRMAGPREALWHALIRKNHGCTHFIIGRDHAGPSAVHSITGAKFYEPFEAHTFVNQYAHEIGITLLLSPEIVYWKPGKQYLCANDVRINDAEKETRRLSGTELRRRLKANEEIPSWFTYPEVEAELRRVFQRKGLCVYFVGLSCSGKSTLAKALAARIRETTARPVTILDGDLVRRELSRGLGFSREDRSLNVRRIGFVAKTVVEHGGIVICANIAPYEEDREFNRIRISQVGNYVEVFVSTTVSECERRDVKGLYRKARTGLITQFTGISDPFEIPSSPSLIVETDNVKVSACVEKVWEHVHSLL